MKYIPRLKRKYQEEVILNLKGNYKSVMQVPKLIKICLNQGIGSAASDKKQVEAAQNEMTMITGQKAILTKSKKDISNFKLRKGMPVGVMVTLRGDKMYEFLDRLVTSTMPRVRDFNGISTKGFDGRGNYTMGIKEQIAFSEISIDKVQKVTGMDITFVTSTNSDNEALALLKELGLPFKTNSKEENDREEEIKKVKEKKRLEEEKKRLEEESKAANSQDNESMVVDNKNSDDSIDNNIGVNETNDVVKKDDESEQDNSNLES